MDYRRIAIAPTAEAAMLSRMRNSSKGTYVLRSFIESWV